MRLKYIISGILFILVAYESFAQELLSKEVALDLALSNNYQIMVVRNEHYKAENNTSIYNSGLLPTLNASAGGNYNLSNGEAGFNDGSVRELNWASSNSVNTSIGINYILFDGFNRKYNIEQFQHNYQLSELQVRSVVENVILQVFLAYFEVARLQENYFNLNEAQHISRNRLQRARYQNEFGQNSYLAVSNALVDINTDSINVLNIIQQLENSKRNLNVLLGRDISIEFTIDTAVTFQQTYVKSELEQAMLSSNIELNLAKQGLVMNENVLKINQSSFYPQVSLNASYGWSKNNNNEASFFAYSINSGVNAGLSLSWNLFDGGFRYIRQQNALVDMRNQEIELKRIEQELTRDFNNAWGNYHNSLFVLKAQEDNLRTNQINFQRTEEQYRIGRVTSIEFRQAQLNLLNAQTSRNQAKYEAKIAELELLQISGKLLESGIQ